MHVGVDLTLMEREDFPGESSLFWVTPILRQDEFGKLSPESRRQLHPQALAWYAGQLEHAETRQDRDLEEAIYHGLQAGECMRVVDYALELGDRYNKSLLYQDNCEMLQTLANALGPEEIERAVTAGKGNIAVLFNNQGMAWNILGDTSKAIQFSEQALNLFTKVYGIEHPSTQTVAANLESLRPSTQP